MSDATEPKLLFGRGYYTDFDQFALLLRVTTEREGEIKAARDIAGPLGVPDARAAGLVNLARGFDILERTRYLPTTLGRLIARRDPFFDDLGTLWFLHYTVAFEPRQIVWNRFANVLVPGTPRFTLREFRALFTDLGDTHADYSAGDHVEKETLTVLDAYTRKHFSRLGYITPDGAGGYGAGDREPVPPLILAASLARFRDRHHPHNTALSIPDICTAPNSPGVIFNLREDRLRAILERLKMQPGFTLESRADLDQVRLDTALPAHAWIDRYYDSR